MKILIVGSNYSWSIENYFIKYFSEMGLEIELFPAQKFFYKYYYASLINKLLFKLHLSKIESSINKSFLKFILSTNPTHILVFKGMEITPASLKWAKKQGIKLINYNPDNPFVFSGKGSGNANITNSIDIYDFHFTYNLEIQKKLEEKHHKQTGFLPFAYDVSQELYEECAKENEIVKVCFIGNPDKTRAAFLEQIADKGIEIDVFGNDWKKFISNKSITLHSPVYGFEQWKTLRKYRVQLNIMRIHNLDSHNMRSFEIPGIGGIQLAPNTKEHELFFEDGKEIFLYKNVNECVDKIIYLLTLSTTQANELRILSRNAASNKKYSYKDRAMQVLETLLTL